MPRDDDPAHDETQVSSDTIVSVGTGTPDSSEPNDTIAGVPPGPSGSSPRATPFPLGSSSSSTRLSLPSYDLRELLGRGGMGDVVLARDREIGRDVAVKALRADKASAEDVARFLREARIQARLEHPAILPVHQIGRDELGNPYFTMKRLVGTTFGDQLASPIRPPRQRLLRLFADACSAVQFAHSRGVIHRDLKPANIMIGDFNEVYVLDWGLARVEGERDAGASLADAEPEEDGVTETGAMLGTPGYMAPEQIQDASKAGFAADVYALGAILFEILTGESLHPRGRAAIASTLRGVDVRASRRNPEANVPPELDELCARCLATAPSARPNVRELTDRLQGYLDGDRDHERRRDFAAACVRQARELLATGDDSQRAEAAQAVARALSVDPESAEAGALMTRLMFERTATQPEALRRELTASEVAVQRRQGRAAMGSFLVVLSYLAVAATNGVHNLPFVLGLLAYLAIHASVVWRITQRQATTNQMLVVALGNSLLAALLSRTLGSMIIVPAVTCVMALSLTSYPQLIDRKWTVISFLVLSWITPVILEQVGVLERTWQVVGSNVVLSANVMEIGGVHTALLLVFSNVVTFVVFGLFANALATSRRDAIRDSEAHAWHLRQLVPAPRSSTQGR